MLNFKVELNIINMSPKPERMPAPEMQDDPESKFPNKLEEVNEPKKELPADQTHNAEYWDKVAETLEKQERERAAKGKSKFKEYTEDKLKKGLGQMKERAAGLKKVAEDPTGRKGEVSEVMGEVMEIQKQREGEEMLDETMKKAEEQVVEATGGEEKELHKAADEFALKDQMNVLKEETTNLFKGERGVQALEDALKVKYNYDAARQSVAGFGGKLKVGFRRMFDGGFRKMLNEYNTKLADYNSKKEEQELLDLQLNNPGEYEKYMSGKTTRAVLENIPKKKKKTPR